MNILMIGGTGLLGSAAAQLFIDKEIGRAHV